MVNRYSIHRTIRAMLSGHIPNELIVRKECDLPSSTIRAMLSGPVQAGENGSNEVNFREIPSRALRNSSTTVQMPSSSSYVSTSLPPLSNQLRCTTSKTKKGFSNM